MTQKAEDFREIMIKAIMDKSGLSFFDKEFVLEEVEAILEALYSRSYCIVKVQPTKETN